MAESKTWSSEKTEDALPALCERLSRNPGGGSGAWRLLNGEKPLGLVLMDEGKVCWALSEGLEQRLTDLLVEKHGLVRADIEALYRECRAQGKTLSECLVSKGTLTHTELERVMMQHTAEAFRKLAKLRPSQAEWLPHRAGGYRPSYSFSVGRVLARAAALSAEVEPDALERMLEPIVKDCGFALAYAKGGTLPIAIAGDPPFGLELLLELGRWSGKAFERLSEAKLNAHALTSGLRTGTLMAAEHEECIVLTWSEDPRALARFFGRYARGRHGHLRQK